jgi:hypothetical protein
MSGVIITAGIVALMAAMEAVLIRQKLTKEESEALVKFYRPIWEGDELGVLGAKIGKSIENAGNALKTKGSFSGLNCTGNKCSLIQEETGVVNGAIIKQTTKETQTVTDDNEETKEIPTNKTEKKECSTMYEVAIKMLNENKEYKELDIESINKVASNETFEKFQELLFNEYPNDDFTFYEIFNETEDDDKYKLSKQNKLFFKFCSDNTTYTLFKSETELSDEEKFKHHKGLKVADYHKIYHFKDFSILDTIKDKDKGEDANSGEIDRKQLRTFIFEEKADNIFEYLQKTFKEHTVEKNDKLKLFLIKKKLTKTIDNKNPGALIPYIFVSDNQKNDIKHKIESSIIIRVYNQDSPDVEDISPAKTDTDTDTKTPVKTYTANISHNEFFDTVLLLNEITDKKVNMDISSLPSDLLYTTYSYLVYGNAFFVKKFISHKDLDLNVFSLEIEDIVDLQDNLKSFKIKIKPNNKEEISEQTECDENVLGLMNVGASCYINAALQIMNVIDPKTFDIKEFREDYEGMREKIKNEYGYNGEQNDSYSVIVQHMIGSLQNKENVLDRLQIWNDDTKSMDDIIKNVMSSISKDKATKINLDNKEFLLLGVIPFIGDSYDLFDSYKAFKQSITEDPLQFNENIYKLEGIIIHIGNTFKSGHYTALVKRGKLWYYIDDKKVECFSSSHFVNWIKNLEEFQKPVVFLFKKITKDVELDDKKGKPSAVDGAKGGLPGDQPGDLPAEGGLPGDKQGDLPADLPAEGGLPGDQQGDLPADLPAEGDQQGDQQGDLPAEGDQQGEQQGDLPAEGGLPGDLPAEGGLPGDLPAEGGLPGDQQGDQQGELEYVHTEIENKLLKLVEDIINSREIVTGEIELSINLVKDQVKKEKYENEINDIKKASNIIEKLTEINEDYITSDDDFEGIHKQINTIQNNKLKKHLEYMYSQLYKVYKEFKDEAKIKKEFESLDLLLTESEKILPGSEYSKNLLISFMEQQKSIKQKQNEILELINKINQDEVKKEKLGIMIGYNERIVKETGRVNKFMDDAFKTVGGYTTSNWVGILSGLAVIAACAFRP